MTVALTIEELAADDHTGWWVARALYSYGSSKDFGFLQSIEVEADGWYRVTVKNHMGVETPTRFRPTDSFVLMEVAPW